MHALKNKKTKMERRMMKDDTVCLYEKKKTEKNICDSTEQKFVKYVMLLLKEFFFQAISTNDQKDH